MHNDAMLEETATPLPEWSTERLDSWKEIASFFRREVRTVQLWEKNEGLPVRRQHHRKLGSVFAYRRELENWWASRSALTAGCTTQGLSEVASTKGQNAAQHSTSAESARVRTDEATRDTSSARLLMFPLDVIHCRKEMGTPHSLVERFAGGLQEDLLLEIRSSCDLVSLSRGALPAQGISTATFFRNTAREFRADFYLTGTVRYEGSQVRVHLQLTRSLDAVCVWADRYETALEHVFQEQSEIAHKIARPLPPYMIQRLGRHALGSGVAPEPAYHACMMGLHFWKQRTRLDLMKALSYFRDASLLDPSCADAYAGLADTYVSLSYNHLMPPRRAIEAAKMAVESGLKLAPESLNVRNAEINFKVNCAWDWAGAERLCRQTVDSGRVDSRTLQLYASLMINLGRHDEAIRLSLHAHRLDPLSDSVNSQVSFAYFYAGDYANALSFIDRTIQLRPRFAMGHALLGRTQAERGDWDQAIESFEQGLALSAESVFLKALLAYGHAGRGDAESANGLLAEIESNAGDECFPAYDVSAVHAKLNQESEALQKIVKAYDMRDMKIPYIQYDPRFTSLRTLPQFRKITSSIFSCAV